MNEKELEKLNYENFGMTMNGLCKDLENLLERNKKYRNKKQNIIKYLEDKIKEYENSNLLSSAGKVIAYTEILNKIKDDNYE